MIRLIILFVLMSCTSGSDNESHAEIQADTNTITIKGTVGYPQQGIILLERIENNQAIPYDTFKLNDRNQFEEEVIVSSPGYYRLNFYNKQQVVLILEDEDLEINVDGNDRNGFVSITGSDAHDLINEVQLAQQQFQQGPNVARLNQEFSTAMQQGDVPAQEKIQEEYRALEDEHNKSVMAKMDSAGITLAIIDLLSSGRIIDKDRYFTYYDKKAAEFKDYYPENERVIAFIDQVEKMRVTSIGSLAPEIALPNPEGDTIKLSSLRGKYVLLDFWAKWCKPCRMENPNVVRMFNKYNDQGFEVYGVSLDRNKEDWVQAIQEDQLFWTQVSDLKFWNSEAARTYGINAIPFALLLDPEGRIIAKNLRGKELERKLEDIFEK